MPKGERTKKLSFRLWTEGKSVAETQAKICGESEIPPSSVKEWIVEWERGRQKNGSPRFQTDEEQNDDQRTIIAGLPPPALSRLILRDAPSRQCPARKLKEIFLIFHPSHRISRPA